MQRIYPLTSCATEEKSEHRVISLRSGELKVPGPDDRLTQRRSEQYHLSKLSPNPSEILVRSPPNISLPRAKKRARSQDSDCEQPQDKRCPHSWSEGKCSVACLQSGLNQRKLVEIRMARKGRDLGWNAIHGKKRPLPKESSGLV